MMPLSFVVTYQVFFTRYHTRRGANHIEWKWRIEILPSAVGEDSGPLAFLDHVGHGGRPPPQPPVVKGHKGRQGSEDGERTRAHHKQVEEGGGLGRLAPWAGGAWEAAAGGVGLGVRVPQATAPVQAQVVAGVISAPASTYNFQLLTHDNFWEKKGSKTCKSKIAPSWWLFTIFWSKSQKFKPKVFHGWGGIVWCLLKYFASSPKNTKGKAMQRSSGFLLQIAKNRGWNWTMRMTFDNFCRIRLP